jgi:hypothetical protein
VGLVHVLAALRPILGRNIKMIRVHFQCRDCGGNVIDCRKDGRYFEHRGVVILLPADFNIPRCAECKVDWFSDQLIKDLELVLEAEYVQHGDLIKSIIELYSHHQK